MKHILTGIIIGALAGGVACTTPTVSGYTRNVKAWVGRTPEELITAWGPPTQVLENGETLYYIYTVNRTIPLPGTQARDPSGQLQYISPLQETPAYETDLFCQTTFVVSDDVITDWSFQGDACRAR